MAYRLRDAFESAAGAFSAVLLFFALRVEPISISPVIGLAITFVWLSLFYEGDRRVSGNNFIFNIIVVFIVSGIITYIFGLADTATLLSFDYFGSTAIVGVWLGFPIALLMDRYNIKNILNTKYIRKR